MKTSYKQARIHNESKHGDIKFDCDHCEYKATTKSSLRVYRKQLKISLSNKSTKNQNMKESSLVVTSVTTKHRTSRLLGFINNQNTGISNLNVNNASTKQQK